MDDGTPEGGAINNRKRIFKQIIVKCVLQLLLIETVRELLQNMDVYRNTPPQMLLRLLDRLEHSYQFARAFNEDKELRMGLWKVGQCSSELVSTIETVRSYTFPQAS